MRLRALQLDKLFDLFVHVCIEHIVQYMDEPWYCVSWANTIVDSEILCNMNKEWGVVLVQL